MGSLLIILYMLLSASKAVYLSHLLQLLDPIVVLFYTFFIAWALFVMIAGIQGRLRFLVQFSIGNWKSIVWFNLFTVGCWATFFAAVKLLEPSAHAVIANASQPLIALFLPGVVVGVSLNASRILHRSGLWLIATGVVLQIVLILLGKSALRDVPLQRSLLGISMSALCAVSLALNRKVNYSLQNQGLRASDLMVVRFLGLLALSAILRYQDLGFTPQSATLLWSHVWQIGLVGIFGVTIPVYALQKGQTMTDEFSAALITSLMPLTMLLIQALDARFTFSLGSIIATGVVTGGSICVLVAKKRSTLRKGTIS